MNSPFSPAFLKKLQNEQIPNPKEKIYCTHILSSDLTINLLFNLVFCIKCISSEFNYLCLCDVCKKQINKIKKRSTGRYQSLHFLTISYVSLLYNFVEGIRSKKKPCRFGARMMLNLTWLFAKLNRDKMFPPSA